MRDLNIHEQSHSNLGRAGKNLGGAGKKLGKAGKKALSMMKKEHNGPDGHRIPDKFGTISKNIGSKVTGQSLRFHGPTGQLVYGGPDTDVAADAKAPFAPGTPVKVISGNKPQLGKGGLIMDDDFIVVEDND